MHQIKIDKEKCTGCKRCYKACLYDVIRWVDEEKTPVAKYPEECATCNWCELSCPVNAIEVIPDYIVPYPRYYPKSIYPKTHEDF
ncbi:MAG: 4Fe-4S binding protein [Peptococcaceae bacterium]|nr:4Fe-4S binding protein [Peptococcaceae bacterium]